MVTLQREQKTSVAEYIAALEKSPKFGSQVVYHKVIEQSAAHYYAGQQPLFPDLQDSLGRLGLTNLYSHQAEAIQCIQLSHNVMVTTPTASGKSMVYNLPVIEKIKQGKFFHALYLFPLKALAQDQMQTITILAENLLKKEERPEHGIAAIYDGDTTAHQRRRIREKTPPVVITNPEMLHLSFLPFHENWSNFFANLDFVIIDEVHTYRGILGTHVSWLLRRLNRLLQHYRKTPIYILSSATIGNAEMFAASLTGRDINVISQTGAPQTKRHFLFLNPWDSAAYTASQLLEASLKRGLRTIVYTQSRKMTELISLWTKPRLKNIADKLSSYRAGFLPEERREIEKKLSDGSLLGVVTTSALELGINIGDLDLCILVGFPGSIMATLQRGGRVGRGGREAAVILIGSEDALDQYYMRNPEAFFSREIESAVINPLNRKIMKEHLHCAAAEKPLSISESLLMDTVIRKAVFDLAENSTLLRAAEGETFFASRKRPQRNVALRGGGSMVIIINGKNGLIIGEIDAARALKECHDGAIYLHQGETWLVERLDLSQKEVVVSKNKSGFFTRPMSSKNTEILTILERKELFGCVLTYGNLRVSEKVTGYQKRNHGSNKLITTIPLNLPEQTIETEGFWLEIPQHIIKILEEAKYHFMGGLHALEHVMISTFPLLVLCERNDVGGISCPFHEQTTAATIFIYDGYPGGSGLSREAYDKAAQLIPLSHDIVTSCKCENGCPSCVHSPKCGSGNRPIDKLSCLRLLADILSRKTTNLVIAEKMDVSLTTTAIENCACRRQNGLSLPVMEGVEGLETLPTHFGVFDLETQFSAEEVGGWHRAEKMRVSVGVVYDSLLDGYVTYLENEIDRLLEHLQSLDLVIGFNNKKFDNRVLSPYTRKDLSLLPALDLLEEITNQLGYRLSLNAVAEHTLGISKGGDGLQALQWYRAGEFTKLCKYCQKDVEITKNLVMYALENGFLLFQNKAGKKVRLPLALGKKILSLRTFSPIL